jgi:hypothetical protein
MVKPHFHEACFRGGSEKAKKAMAGDGPFVSVLSVFILLVAHKKGGRL